MTNPSHKEPTVTAIRDCYPCSGKGFIVGQLQFKTRCGNCGGTGVSPTWAMSDGSDEGKRPLPLHLRGQTGPVRS